MKKTNYVTGLDIGTTKIMVVVANCDEYGKIRVLGIGKSESPGVTRGVVSNIKQTIESIKTAVKLAEDSSGRKIKNVTVGIAGQHIRSLQQNEYISRENPDRLIDESDTQKLADQVLKIHTQEGENIIHALPQEYKVDNNSDIRDPVGMYGSRLEANFHVVLGKNTSMKHIRDCVEGAGLELTGMILEPIASADAVLTEDEKEAGVALVDIGGGTTDLAIFKGGIVRHTAVIPFGGNVITDDIREGCSIVEKFAEKLKVDYGSVWPGENSDQDIVTIPGLKGRKPREVSKLSLSKIIHARITEIMSAVFSEIKIYDQGDQKKKLIGGIVLTGGGSELKHIKQLMEYLTAMDTRIGLPNEHLSGSSSTKITNPIFATSIGLASNALKSESTSKDEKSHNHNCDESEMSQKESEETLKKEIVKPGDTKDSNKTKKFVDTILKGVNGFLKKIE